VTEKVIERYRLVIDEIAVETLSLSLNNKRDFLFRKTFGITSDNDFFKGERVFVIGTTVSIMKTYQDYLDYTDDYQDIIYKTFTILDIKTRFDLSFGFVHPRAQDNVFILNTFDLIGKDLFVYKECLLKSTN
jgi:hypothetical protein